MINLNYLAPDQTEDIEQLLNHFDSKIKQTSRNASYHNRHDLEQELRLKIIEKLLEVEFREAPEFWWFFQDCS
ncbi:helix-turn-helix domain-containing protein [Oceanobacillus locisalsi]|uniref:Helix-turn-helix domain-containing protein n=1 Tax=Oceanobacillus locisalsi TaxID=546107 RepID=A0ABW3NAM9_9BACI